ncbi:hypothetical protein KsCSTR_32320 [Candidatus Kuenenia stuttgartiensis]|uniref:Uncharacterized protein n=1 Tax=Kuenenia stuttgartiensis TaxID=174633 RepID=Q1Q4Q0_KUEST|nr:hypothetical protein KsCSTR_32320 [Candidatus Kuenenia stuttgartiensis]CAJ74995.1 unknown protein [Candidatus Kuenenia stuttgartiensis]
MGGLIIQVDDCNTAYCKGSRRISRGAFPIFCNRLCDWGKTTLQGMWQALSPAGGGLRGWNCLRRKSGRFIT